MKMTLECGAEIVVEREDEHTICLSVDNMMSIADVRLTFDQVWDLAFALLDARNEDVKTQCEGCDFCRGLEKGDGI